MFMNENTEGTREALFRLIWKQSSTHARLQYVGVPMLKPNQISQRGTKVLHIYIPVGVSNHSNSYVVLALTG